MPLDHIPFNRDGLCGAACAQMVLHAQALMGTSSAEQELLWSSIKAHTLGQSVSLPCSGFTPSGSFPNMIRELCANQDVICWATYPDALKETLEAFYAFAGKEIAIALTEHDSEAAANDVIQGCLQRGGLPIVLVHSGKHWVVVGGWNSNQVKPVRLLDPARQQPSDHNVSDWNVFFMSAVDCGQYGRKYVVLEVGP